MIEAFLRGLESIFAWLIEASWQASVLVALVLLLHLILRGRLNPRWHHALWLLVIARLLLPFLPESAFSVFQFAPSPPPVVTETVTEPIFNALPVPMAGTPLLPAPPAAYPFSAFTVLALVWLAGALALLILTWQVNRRFARHVVAAPLVTNPRLLKLAETAQQELGLHRRLRIIESAQVQSPAIMGLFRPTLILPKDVRARFEDDELRFIFLHEFAHLKRGDLFLQWLVALLQILHWFNPALWYAFRRMRADREPATDALVLSCTGEAYKESYGQVLVKLLEHYHQRHSLPTLVGILEDKDQFKRRFSLIAKFTRGAYGWSLLGVLLIAALGAICLTKAKAQDTAPRAEKYLETIFVETPGAMNGAGSGPRRPVDLLQMLGDPKNNVSVLADVVLKDGPILLKGKTPATFDYTITGDWKNSITEPQKIDIRIDDHATPGLQHSWETKESLSQGQPVVVFQSWKSASHANLLIRIVDHPGSVNSATDTGRQSHDTNADPTTMPTDGTLAQIVLALKDNAQAIPSDHQRLQILQSFYGADGSWRDVTGILQKSIQNNSLKVSWQQPYTEIGGDPAYLQVKTLIVSYRLDGVEKLATFREENSPVGLQALIPVKNEETSSDPNAKMLEGVRKGVSG
jgi:beta-lactamase regulating signal transducer with metallopeptidase domain